MQESIRANAPLDISKRIIKAEAPVPSSIQNRSNVSRLPSLFTIAVPTTAEQIAAMYCTPNATVKNDEECICSNPLRKKRYKGKYQEKAFTTTMNTVRKSLCRKTPRAAELSAIPYNPFCL
jgi:hypothetical protein